MTLTRADLARSIVRHCGYSRRKSHAVIEALIEIIKASLEKGEDIMISGFGKMWVRKTTGSRQGHRILGNGWEARPRAAITFKCSRVLRDRLNPRAVEALKPSPSPVSAPAVREARAYPPSPRG